MLEFSSKYDVVPPTLEEVESIARTYHMALSHDEVREFAAQIERALRSYRRVGQLPEPKPDVKYPRTPGYRPTREENPLNAWYWKCSVKGALEGKLAGKKVAIKDNVCVAGVPMMNGSAILEGFIPDVDATIVTRILDAGGEVVGKAACDNLCCSGGANTPATGPISNPHKPEYSAGGSSGGSAALVVAGDCDMATGGDQGGSIRVPAAWCGAYGLKPSYGLVPYTGIFPLEMTLDHAGPICNSTADIALLLEVIAGKDPLDPRQPENVPTEAYTQALTGSVDDLTVGVVKEGFGWGGSSDVYVDEAVKEAAFGFGKLRAKVREISIPMHREAFHIFTVISNEGALVQMIITNGFGSGWKGYYPTSAIDYFGKARKVMANNFPDTVKLIILLGHYMLTRYQGRYYAKAQNQARLLRDAYDSSLREVDILVMPTCAPEGLALAHVENPTIQDIWRVGWRAGKNTAPFNVSGHPSMSIPCGKGDGLPIGMMLVGRHYEDSTVLRAAHAFESLGLYR